jgi:hypothetical protein
MVHPVAVEVIEMCDAIQAADLSPEELVAAMRAVAEKIAAHPDVVTQLPPGFVEKIMKASDNLDRATANAKELERRAIIARQNHQMLKAKFDRLADQLLDNQDDQKKGN